jgi:prevent-host-death family protein
MDLSDAIEPVTVLKTRSAELIRRARESRQPVIITQNGKATAVLQDVESYQRQRQALMLLRYVALGERDLRDGSIVSDAEADGHFRAKLKSLADKE